MISCLTAQVAWRRCWRQAAAYVASSASAGSAPCSFTTRARDTLQLSRRQRERRQQQQRALQLLLTRQTPTTAHPHRSNDPAERWDPFLTTETVQDESGQALVDIQQAQTTAEPAPHCTIPDHIQALFEANKYEKPDIGGFIRAGLTDEQVTWYDALQVARYSLFPRSTRWILTRCGSVSASPGKTLL